MQVVEEDDENILKNLNFEIFLVLLTFSLETFFFFFSQSHFVPIVLSLQIFLKGLDNLQRNHFLFIRSIWSEVSNVAFSSISQRHRKRDTPYHASD